MKLTDKMRWTLCILAAFILMGTSLVLYLLGVPYNPKIMRALEFGMLMVVMYLLVIYPRQNRFVENNTEENDAEENNIEAVENTEEEK